MKPLKYIILVCLISLLGTSCENDGFYYQDEPRIRLVGPEIWTLKTDSLEFSFVVYPEDVTSYQMDIEAHIMGTVAEHDRTLKLAVDAGKTTATDNQYTVPNTVTIPAGNDKAVFPVILKRDASLANKTVRLYIKVDYSDDFKTGVNEENHLLLKWNDQLSQPKNWETELKTYFGTYSDEKYRFMLNNAGGISEFSTETMSWAQLTNYKIVFTNLLDEYNAAHPEAPYSFNFND